MRTIYTDRIPFESFQTGSHTLVTLSVDLHALYQRPRNVGERRLGLKVFRDQMQKGDTPKTFLWKPSKGKGTSIHDATVIQNIFWLEGIAPRVLDIVKVKLPDATHFAQVVEVAENSERGKESSELQKKIEDVCKRYGIERNPLDPNRHHQYKDLVVYFSNTRFINDTYEAHLKKLATETTGWGSDEKPYQSIPELGIIGQRDLKNRLGTIGSSGLGLDYEGKTVIDYGCSSGAFLRYANQQGAVRCVGLEVPEMIRTNYEIANYLGCWNIDFYGGDFTHHDGGLDIYRQIKDLTGLSQFDIVLYLSCQQLKWPQYLTEIVGETFVLEGHVPDQEETYRPQLEGIFRHGHVYYKGKTSDHGPRPVFVCTQS